MEEISAVEWDFFTFPNIRWNVASGGQTSPPKTVSGEVVLHEAELIKVAPFVLATRWKAGPCNHWVWKQRFSGHSSKVMVQGLTAESKAKSEGTPGSGYIFQRQSHKQSKGQVTRMDTAQVTPGVVSKTLSRLIPHWLQLYKGSFPRGATGSYVRLLLFYSWRVLGPGSCGDWSASSGVSLAEGRPQANASAPGWCLSPFPHLLLGCFRRLWWIL